MADNSNNNDNDEKIDETEGLIDSILDHLKDHAEKIINESQEEKPAKKTGKLKKKNEILPADQVLPAKLPIIPLQGRPIFPGIFTPLMVTNQEDIKAIDQAIERRREKQLRGEE